MKLIIIKLIRLLFRKTGTEKNAIQKLLIIRQDNRIGNLLFITALIRECKKAFPEASVDVLASTKFSAILDRNPYIDNIREYRHKEFIFMPWKLFSLIRKLRRYKYDIVIDTKDVFSFNNSFITIASGGAKVVGYGYAGAKAVHDVSVPIPSDNMYEPLRHLQLLRAINEKVSDNGDMEIYLSENEIEGSESLLKQYGLQPGGFVAIHCGGRGRKSYGIDRFITVASILFSQHGLKSIIIYGPDESDEIGKIANQEGITFLMPVDVRQMAGLIYHCRIFLGGDTGALHIAAALGKRTVSLFFRSNSARYAPKGESHTLYYDFDKPPAEDVVANLVAGSIVRDKRRRSESKDSEADFDSESGKDSISIILATYNGEKYIAQQMQSLINQDFANFRIICIDDCSTDKTIEILREFQTMYPNKISIEMNENNLGSRKNFEKGCTIADGKYLAFCDQDDWWYPDKLKLLYDRISRDARLAFVYSNAELVDKNLNTLKYRIWNSHEAFRGEKYYQVVIRNVVMGCTILARTDFVKSIIPFPAKGVHHDYYLAIMAIAGNYQIDFIDKPLVKYRQHEFNVVGRDKRFKKKSSYRDKTIRRYNEVSLLDFNKIHNMQLLRLLKLKKAMLENMINRMPLTAFRFHKDYYDALDRLNINVDSHRSNDFRTILRSLFYKWPLIDSV